MTEHEGVIFLNGIARVERFQFTSCQFSFPLLVIFIDAAIKTVIHPS